MRHLLDVAATRPSLVCVCALAPRLSTAVTASPLCVLPKRFEVRCVIWSGWLLSASSVPWKFMFQSKMCAVCARLRYLDVFFFSKFIFIFPSIKCRSTSVSFDRKIHFSDIKFHPNICKWQIIICVICGRPDRVPFNHTQISIRIRAFSWLCALHVHWIVIHTRASRPPHTHIRLPWAMRAHKSLAGLSSRLS